MNNENNNSVENTEQTNNLVQNNQPEPQIQPVQDVTPVQNIQSEPQVQPVQSVSPVQNIQPEPQVQPVQDVAPVQNIQPEVKNKKSKLPILIILLLLVAAGIAGYFIVFKKNGKKIVVDKTIDKLFSSFDDLYKDFKKENSFNYKKDKIEYEGNINVKITPKLENTEAINLEYNAQIDLKNKEAYYNFSTGENNKELINFTTMLKDKNLFIKTNLYNQVLKYDLSGEEEFNNFNADELPNLNEISYEMISSKIKKYLKESIKDEYVTQETGKFTVDNKTLKGVKTTIKFDIKTEYKIKINILNEIKKDKEMIDLLCKISNKNKDEVNEKIDEIIKNYNEEIESYNDYKEYDNLTDYFIIYTTRFGKVLGYEYHNGTAKTYIGIYEKNILKVKYSNKYGSTYNIEYDEKKKELIIKDIKKGDNDWSTFITNFDISSLKISYGQNKFNLEIVIRDINTKIDYNQKNNNQNIEKDLNVNVAIGDEKEHLNIDANYNSTTKKFEKLKNFDVTNTKDINSLTDTDYKIIRNNLKNALKNSLIDSLGFLDYLDDNENEEHNTSDY